MLLYRICSNENKLFAMLREVNKLWPELEWIQDTNLREKTAPIRYSSDS